MLSRDVSKDQYSGAEMIYDPGWFWVSGPVL